MRRLGRPRRRQLLARTWPPRSGERGQRHAAPRSSPATPRRPAPRRSTYGRVPARASWRRWAGRRRPSAASGTSSPRATSSAPPSTSTRPTPGASRSWPASRARCARSPTRSCPAARSTTRSPRSTPTRPARSAARRRSATGCRRSPTATMQRAARTPLRHPRAGAADRVLLAPTSDGGIYYTGPSEDFSRPGRMWWAVPQGVDDVLHLARGHHGLPRGRARPSPAGRRRPPSGPSCSTAGGGCCAGAPGHGEGWALYAERLMDELGYLDDPGDRLGMLDAQAFRAARVIVDIGMHLELEIPAGQPVRLPPGRAVDPGAGLGVHAGALPGRRTRTCASSSTATWAGPARRRSTRSASASGCRPATTPRPARAPTST